MQYVNVIIGNEQDVEKIFRIKAADSNVAKGNIEGCKKISKELFDKFKCKYVPITLNESFSVSDNRWSGLLYDGRNYYFSNKYKVYILDRVGGGDSFTAGLIFALL